MHQRPVQTVPSAQANLTGSRLLLGASREYCTSLSSAHGSIIHLGSDNQGALYFVEDGLAVATKRFIYGKGQIVAIYIPGDIINHEEVTFGRSFSEVSAVSDVRLARISTSDFARVIRTDSLYEQAFHRYVAYQAILVQERLANIGRKSAIQRTAHLLCELFCRLQMASLTVGDTCSLPLTQATFADITGLSLVHQNRSLKHIKDAGLATCANRRLRIIDWNGLAELADFDRTYLEASASYGA